MSERSAGGGIAARYVWLDPDRLLAPGELRWDAAGRIVAARRARGRVLDLAVLPASVAAHAHLDLDPLPRAERRFLPWIRAVLRQRGGQDAAARRATLRRSVQQLLHGGATAVGDIDATGDSWDMLARTPLRGRSYRELTGYHLDDAAAEQLVASRPARGRGGIAAGLSPHAPYSVSASLFRAAHRRQRHLAIHCAEVPEEQQFLRHGTGPFADLLLRLGRLPPQHRAPGVGAVAWLERLAVLGERTQLVHCQELERGDVARIAAAGCSIVVCPGTITFFRRQPPDVARWLAHGIPVALGTDSLASNRSLSMRDELAAAARCWPKLAPTQLLRLATVGGGRALSLPRVGTLRRGARADFVSVPCGADADGTLAGYVHGESPLLDVHAAGRSVLSSRTRAVRDD